MSKNELEPTGGQPVWPLAPQGGFPLQPWAPQPQASRLLGGDLNLATLWRIASEWRWLILGAVAVGVAGAIVITFLTTPLYRAAVMLEINPPQVEAIDQSKVVRGEGGGYFDQRAYMATQVGLLKSRNLAERVAQDLNLASNSIFVPSQADRAIREKVAVGKLTGGFVAKPLPDSRLIQLTYVSTSPDLAAQVANSFADNFINSNLERRYQSTAYARQFLERQIAKTKTELENSERQLVAYAQAHNIINTAGGDDAKGSDVTSLQGQQLVALNQALAEAQTRRIAAEEAYRNEMRVGNTADVNSSTAPLRTERAQLESQYQEKLSSFKPEYPEMQRMRARIDSLDQLIRRESSTVAGGRVNTLLAQYRAAAATERMIQSKVNTAKGQVLGIRADSIQYNILQRSVDTTRAMYDTLLDRYKQVGVAGGVGSNNVS